MKSVFFVFVYCLLACAASAQTCLDDFCFLTARYDGDITDELADGYCAFVFETAVESEDLIRIANHLSSNTEARISLLFSGSNNLTDEQLSSAGLDKYLYSQSAQNC